MKPKYFYGRIPDIGDQRDHQFALTAPVSLPPSADLRPFMPPVYDQGQIGSCTANSVSAAVDYHRQRAGHPFISPSRLFVYYNERSLEHTISRDSGASVRDSLKAVNKYGAPCEAEWPYLPGKYRAKPAKSAYADALINFSSNLPYQAVAQSLIALKTALAAGLPVCVGISVYESFESEEVARTGVVPMPALHEAMLGGHAILLVGYDDSKGVFILRNSWGEGWGMKGYFTLPYAYLTNPDLSSDFWVINP